jgi:hypothetical protein
MVASKNELTENSYRKLSILKRQKMKLYIKKAFCYTINVKTEDNK